MALSRQNLINNALNLNEENVINYQEMASLSYDVYKYNAALVEGKIIWTTEDGYPSLNGWKAIEFSDPEITGIRYCGVLYMKLINNGENAIFVLASRGTQNFEINGIDDIEYILRQNLCITDKALVFFEKVKNNVFFKTYSNNLIIFTGHSLGGIISDLLYITYSNPEKGLFSACYTFENPGSYSFLKQRLISEGMTKQEARELLISKGQLVSNICGLPGAINTFRK